jgi:Nucleoside-diphosphate-sugar pyrophosphorylase involved in lipopolysaccharide biosynthesis/translation initiation factor 2B, gamma/epsilon subunits (eIF-2Bgamma/eIF-2Bepsilon)
MKSLPVALLAGGLATRLRPITNTIPKSLVPINGEPFIRHQLRLLKGQGVEELVLCVGHLGEMLREEVGDGSKWGLSVSYSFDGEVLLGTGGALRKALPLLGERFFVLYGDSYLPIDFRAVQAAYDPARADALMTILLNEDRWDSSNVRYEDGRILAYDKKARVPSMRYIDYGLGILSAKVLESYSPDMPFDVADAYRDLAAKGRLAGFEVRTRFYEIGSVAGIADTEAYLSGKEGS